MRFPQSLFLLAVTGSAARASSDKVARPRGVAPEFAKYYQDQETFTCITSPAVKIPFSAVNDDFCDCPDGSDEPGTAACSHLSRNSPLTVADHPGNSDLDPSLALPGFYCKNKGHRPSFVPFQRVNDGICDYELCCDGSDEWARVGGTKCEDRCKEIGKKWRKEEEKRQKSMTAALKKKKELLVDAGRQVQEIEDYIRRLEAEVKGSEVKVRGLEANLKKVEEEERKVVRTSGKGKGKVNALAGVAKARVEELRLALSNVRQQRDDLRSQLKELEDILSKFKVEYNPNFNDEGVKRAVRSWEDYAAREMSTGEIAAEELDLDMITRADDENSGVHWQHWENTEDGCNDSEILYKLAAWLPPTLVNFLEDQYFSVKSFLESRGFISKTEEDSGSESKALTEARNALKAEEDSLMEIKNKLRDERADLEKDYGTAGIFRALKGQCVQQDAGEYTYEHCFLESTKQLQRKGGSSMSMGKFVRIGSTSVEEVNEAGEVVSVEKIALEYDRGQHCWNGPNRSTKVVLECGEQNEILKTAEDEKCVYSMLVTTPAVCAGGEENDGAPRSKDEL
ncbi:Glucosidase 2 subunit beta [Penicillium argentinense]|uniref:Glucosidase 2 subunit beta n=1 Tax=Penicillium argentinense TaxID=1131581 RepID=A0A9W9EHW4_9EURO|nr:Glucosidase 2 subunit beta [Penicillium argentinense]KAJ5082101.1 Glucosidase 2 subunit beta [Penicillium argentinense]